MKTLIFLSEFVDNRGGVSQSTISIVKGLALSLDFNFKIVLLCPKDSEMSRTIFPDNVIMKTTDTSIWIMSRNSLCGTLRTIIDIYKSIRSFLGKDTWVVTNQPVTSSLISLLPCRHIKEIYINRGGNFQDNGIASRIILKKLQHKSIEYAIGISKRQVDLLIQSGLPKDRVFLIHNGLLLPSVCYTNTHLKKDNLRISTMGFISDLKNQIEGVRLIRLLRNNGINAVLSMYGDPDSDKDYQFKIAQIIKNLGVESYVNYCGFVSGEKLFAETDILISFSRTEGFGRSLVEGMLRYKPIIAWRGAGGPVDITDDGKYGHLVERNDALDYFEVVSRLLIDPMYNMRNVEESYNYACQHFTVDCMVKNYVELFRSICK